MNYSLNFLPFFLMRLVSNTLLIQQNTDNNIAEKIQNIRNFDQDFHVVLKST